MNPENCKHRLIISTEHGIFSCGTCGKGFPLDTVLSIFAGPWHEEDITLRLSKARPVDERSSLSFVDFLGMTTMHQPSSEIEELRLACEAVLSFCRFEDDRIELPLGRGAYVAHPSLHPELKQFEFLMALWVLKKVLEKETT